MENKEPKEEVSELKELAISNTVETFLADDDMRKKLMRLLGAIALPAFNSLEKKLGNDETRFILYRDKDYGIILHQLKTATTEMSFDEPDKEDIFIITKEQVSNIEALLEKLMKNLGGKLF